MYSDWVWSAIGGFLGVWLLSLTYLIWQQHKIRRERVIRRKFSDFRVELLRYNPYDDTGGDQSFSLALLDDQGNGIVLTSLHARSGTRVFAKPIHLGKGSKHHLSEEEQLVVEKAMKHEENN